MKGQLRGAATPDEVQTRVEALRALPFIDVREFIHPASDIDVLSPHSLTVEAATYGVGRIDVIDRNRLDPTTEEGRTERDQGHIPVEKIRFGKSGVIAPAPQENAFGDGAQEIYAGRPTVHFTPRDIFDTTGYAVTEQNHPVLLAFRYLRMLATDYFYEYGRGGSGTFLPIDPISEQATRRVLAEALTDPRLLRLLEKPAFARKLNTTVQKVFRTYTHPDVGIALFRALGAQDVVEAFAAIESTNQYLFAQPRDEAARAAWLDRYGVDPGAFYSLAGDFFPDGRLYHGTRREEDFRALLQGGVLPSEAGSSGRGLYGVSARNLEFARQWANSPDRVVWFDIRAGARLVDTTRGEGLRIYQRFTADFPREKNPTEAFATAFGVDILRYPYQVEAFVVKNSEVLGRATGLTRQILTAGQLLETARRVVDADGWYRLVENMRVNTLTTREKSTVVSQVAYLEQFVPALADADAIEHFLNFVDEQKLPPQAFTPWLAKIAVEPFATRVRLVADFVAGVPVEGRPRREFNLLRFLCALDALALRPTDTALAARTQQGLERLIEDLLSDLRRPLLPRVGPEDPREGMQFYRMLRELLRQPGTDFHADWILKNLADKRAHAEALSKTGSPYITHWFTEPIKDFFPWALVWTALGPISGHPKMALALAVLNSAPALLTSVGNIRATRESFRRNNQDRLHQIECLETFVREELRPPARPPRRSAAAEWERAISLLRFDAPSLAYMGRLRRTNDARLRARLALLPQFLRAHHGPNQKLKVTSQGYYAAHFLVALEALAEMPPGDPNGAELESRARRSFGELNKRMEIDNYSPAVKLSFGGEALTVLLKELLAQPGTEFHRRWLSTEMERLRRRSIRENLTSRLAVLYGWPLYAMDLTFGLGGFTMGLASLIGDPVFFGTSGALFGATLAWRQRREMLGKLDYGITQGRFRRARYAALIRELTLTPLSPCARILRFAGTRAAR